jgi:hypothetical protein
MLMLLVLLNLAMLTGYSVTPAASSKSAKSACGFPLPTFPTAEGGGRGIDATVMPVLASVEEDDGLDVEGASGIELEEEALISSKSIPEGRFT